MESVRLKGSLQSYAEYCYNKNERNVVGISMKIGLIGCGHWGKYILRDLKTLQCEVHIVVRSAKSEERLKEDGEYVYLKISELPEMDAFVIATPTSTHAQIIKEVIEFDKPIFCEKPDFLLWDAKSVKRWSNAPMFLQEPGGFVEIALDLFESC